MNSEHFLKLKEKALTQRYESAKERIIKLEKIANWIQQNEILILNALKSDFEKPKFETQISEILPTTSEICFYKKNLKKWMRDQRVSTPISLFGHRSRIRYENKGVVLIISPWNYPFQLTIAPLVATLAAGNTAVIKPSEMTPATSDLIQKLVQDCFSPNEVFVELGAKEKTEELLCYNFNHVFFTGSTQVGRIIAQACAERLIPITLELGGKSPTIVDETADLQDAAEKIFWGKFLNRGQTCVAPDYLIVHESVQNNLQDKLKTLVQKNTQSQKANLISEKHIQRLKDLSLTKSDVSQTSLSLEAPKSASAAIMKEEIFGPLLPVFSYKNETEIFQLIRQNETPLSLYIFSKRKPFIEKVLNEIPSGGVGINTLIVQFANHHLPFGGVGASGMGRYHGHHGFLELSHHRALIEQRFFSRLRYLFQPPYTPLKYRIVSLFKWLSSVSS